MRCSRQPLIASIGPLLVPGRSPRTSSTWFGYSTSRWSGKVTWPRGRAGSTAQPGRYSSAGLSTMTRSTAMIWSRRAVPVLRQQAGAIQMLVSLQAKTRIRGQLPVPRRRQGRIPRLRDGSLPGRDGHGHTGAGLAVQQRTSCGRVDYFASGRGGAGIAVPGTLGGQNGGGTRRNCGAAANGPCLIVAGGSGATN